VVIQTGRHRAAPPELGRKQTIETFTADRTKTLVATGSQSLGSACGCGTHRVSVPEQERDLVDALALSRARLATVWRKLWIDGSSPCAKGTGPPTLVGPVNREAAAQ
jgi:hypothetical protein